MTFNTSPLPLHRIVYVSTATETLTDDELQDILAISRNNNQAKDITGVLIYSSGNILQVLEGDKEALNSLYKKIQQDFRHHGCIKIQDTGVKSRIFSEWSMGFKTVSTEEFLKLEGYFDLKTNNLHSKLDDSDTTIREMLQLFLINNR